MKIEFKRGDVWLDLFIDLPDLLLPETSSSISIRIINRGCDLSHFKIKLISVDNKIQTDFEKYVRLYPQGDILNFNAKLTGIKLGLGEFIINISGIDDKYNEFTFSKKLKTRIHLAYKNNLSDKLSFLLLFILLSIILILITLVYFSP